MIKRIEDFIKEDSLARFPEESCGLIIDNTKTFRCNNSHEGNKKEHFKIDNREYLAASKTGKITGIYHSHTSFKKEFSILDKTISEEFKLKLVLYHCPDDSFLYYEPNGFNNPYVGKKFKWGKSDCFSLIKNYYRGELGIDLDEEVKDRDKDFFRNNLDIFNKYKYVDIAKRNGLTVYGNKEKLLKNDIILFRNKTSGTFHFAIYIDDNSILHLPDHGVSRISLLTQEKSEDIFSIIRKEKNERIS